ncbi:hypothetical protein [Mycobacteroides abscessus]|uniref:Uncharacterized protein n=1 Tax=Mycobacteroides abscessus TaxID=36809 RepID=A0A0U0ZSP8_9MYCO|nr:hypothetical protein [Mycobacteroides abscessus]CPV66135.1 Uncharacterised protein [Mycobacteroides abscessus]
MTTTEPTPEPNPGATIASPVLPPGFHDAAPQAPGSTFAPPVMPPGMHEPAAGPPMSGMQGGMDAVRNMSSTVPAAARGAGETYPSTGDPGIDEAIRQSFTNLIEMRDAHGDGRTPADGSYFGRSAEHARSISTNIRAVGRSAAEHWTGASGQMYQEINRQLAE